MRCFELILGFALAAPSFAAAQTTSIVQPKLLLSEGDTVLGMGGIEDIATIDINDAEMWTSLVETTFPDNLRNACILRSGFLTLRESTPVIEPIDSELATFGLIALNNAGNLGMLVTLRPTRKGVYWNLKPVALQNEPVDSPIVMPGSVWDSMTIVRLNDANEMYVMGRVVLGRDRKDILVRYRLDGEGNVTEETVLAYAGMDVPPLQTVVGNLATSIVTSFSVNKHGNWVTYIGGVGAEAVMLDMTTILGQEGTPSPAPKPGGGFKDWAELSQTRTAINDRGDYAFSGTAGDNTDYLIDKNGQKFVEEGDVLPSFTTTPISGSAAAPIEIGNNGDVFWRAQVGGGSGSEAAFMRNYDAVVILNRTVIGGKLVNKVESDHNAFSSSPNGRFMACRVELGGEPSILLADFGLTLDLPGCYGNLGVLTHESGRPMIGEPHFVLSMDNAQGVGALARIVFSTRQRIPGSDCGQNTIHGELMTSAAHRIGSLTLPPWNGTGPTSIDLPIPNEIALVDGVFFAQGIFRMPGTRNIRMTNGMRIELAAP